MSHVPAFAAALRDASNAAIEYLDVRMSKPAEPVESWARKWTSAMLECIGAAVDARKLVPMVRAEIAPPTGTHADTWLAGLLTHLDLVQHGHTFLDFPDADELPPDFRGLAEYVESKKNQWLVAASELAHAAHHLDNLSLARGHTNDPLAIARYAIDPTLFVDKVNDREPAMIGGGPNAGTPPSKDAFVEAGMLWPKYGFDDYASFKKFLDQTRSVRNHQDGQRRMVHAADLARAIADRDKRAEDALDIAGDVLSGMKEREAAVRQQNARDKKTQK